MKDSRKGPLAWFAANHVASNILMIFVLVSGGLALASVVIEVFPEIDTDSVTIRVPYRGASPAEAEEGVCVRVEEAIASVEGIKRIRSVAQENMGMVTAELEEDADDTKVLDDIKAAVDRIETFPVETEKPVVAEGDTRRRVITVVLHGDASEKTLKALAERVRDELTARDGVSQVEIAGVRNYEISIEVSEEALRRYGLSFEHVANAVGMSSLDLPGGAVKTRGGEILLRTKGQRHPGLSFGCRNRGGRFRGHRHCDQLQRQESSADPGLPGRQRRRARGGRSHQTLPRGSRTQPSSRRISRHLG
jgi:multidrug efflux pump subunit AcrB